MWALIMGKLEQSEGSLTWLSGWFRTSLAISGIAACHLGFEKFRIAIASAQTPSNAKHNTNSVSDF
jgi:uncharacterized membrane protein YidH (DUF202 family)